MSIMNDLYKDEELEIGKILIVSDGHGFTVAEIKKITKSSKVKKQKLIKSPSVDSLLYQTIESALRAKHKKYIEPFNIYYIYGIKATSIFIRLKSDNVLGSISLDANSMKTLHNACHTHEVVGNAKFNLEMVKVKYDFASEVLAKQKKSNSLKRKNKALDKLLQGYGDAEISDAMTTIEQIMQNSW
jgi:acid stress-induced BolA-like protein IbaG/YrbA